MTDRRWRVWAALIALCAWGGLVLQTGLMAARWGGLDIALARQSFYFTVISNMVTGTAYALIALGAVRLRHPLLIAGLALTMTMVGAVFEILLRPMLHLTGWRIVENALLHDIVPLLSVAAWLFLAEKGRLRARDPWIVALFPILYLVYALVRGRIEGRYPYPFLDGPKIGWDRVGIVVAAISAAFLICGHLMVMLDRRLGRGVRPAAVTPAARRASADDLP